MTRVIYAIIGGIVCLAFALGGGWGLARFGPLLWIEHRSASWPVVPATIVWSVLLPDSLLKSHGAAAAAMVTFTYSAGGTEREATAYVPLPSARFRDLSRAVLNDFPRGGMIDVHVDPADPDRVVVDPGMRGDHLFRFGASLFCAAVGIVGLLVAAFLVRIFLATRSPDATQALVERSNATFARRLAAAERACARDIAGLRRRLLLFSYVPYVYVAAMLAIVLLAIAVFVVGILNGEIVLRAHLWKVLLAPFVALVAILSGLILRDRPRTPPGRDPREYPKLAALIDRLRAPLAAPQIVQVRFTGTFNAGVAVLRSHGPSARSRYELVLGLPLLQALPLDRFEAVLAHELGHVSAHHPRANLRLYEGFDRWQGVMQSVESMKQSALQLAVLPFQDWFIRRFFPRLLAVRRAQEIEADAFAAEAVPLRTCADTLVDVDLRRRFLEEVFWPSFRRVAERQELGSLAPFTAMAIAFSKPRDPAQEKRWLDESLAQPTALAADHPCLRDRLAALEMAPRVPPPAHGSAAVALLGEELASITAKIEHDWNSAARRMLRPPEQRSSARWKQREEQ